MTQQGRESRIQQAVDDLIEAVKPDREEVKAALEHVLAFVPHDVPCQFTDPNDYPYGRKHFNRKALAEDAKCPFFTEAYLYTLLGKEDARTLRARLRALVLALGFTDEQVHDLF